MWQHSAQVSSSRKSPLSTCSQSKWPILCTPSSPSKGLYRTHHMLIILSPPFFFKVYFFLEWEGKMKERKLNLQQNLVTLLSLCSQPSSQTGSWVCLQMHLTCSGHPGNWARGPCIWLQHHAPYCLHHCACASSFYKGSPFPLDRDILRDSDSSIHFLKSVASSTVHAHCGVHNSYRMNDHWNFLSK